MGKEKGAKIASTQIFGWSIGGAGSLWSALGPVWNSFKNAWDTISPYIEKAEGLFESVRKYVEPIYNDYIKPVMNTVNTVMSKVNDVIKWVDDIYNQTIGRIESVYNTLFGRIENLWRDFESTRDKLTRLIGTVNKDLAQKIYDATEKVEANTIGRVRAFRDELEHRIDQVYEELRSRINDFYYALKDIINPIQEIAFRIKDVVDISFEKPKLLSKDTVVTTADTYGADWFESLMMQGTEPTRIRHVQVMFRQETEKEMDRIIDEIRAGKEGPWGDVASYIDDAVFRVASGLDPAPWEINLDEVEDPYHAFLEPFKNLPKTEEGWAKVMEEIIEEKYDKEV